MIQIEKPQALFLRLKRQNLIEQDHTPYDELFRLMSPVPTKYWVEPGSPLPLKAVLQKMTEILITDAGRIVP
jgi:hypothetical protein